MVVLAVVQPLEVQLLPPVVPQPLKKKNRLRRKKRKKSLTKIWVLVSSTRSFL